jgi:cytochrome c-type biogenesis protein CcmE|tara:strand:+ start:1283 stop:1714 length:432 start_codon:yes stop_codon:yes gene_type:complete
MLTSKIKNRLTIFSILFVLLAVFVIFSLKVLEDSVLYFFSPTDIKNKTDINFNKKIRIGGMVKEGSILSDQTDIKFIVTDFKNEIIVSYNGTVPNLFSEGKGVIAEGKLKDKKFFIAKRILAKHDENYMPPELEKVIQKKDAR